jgi:CHAT domain-containing protein
MRRLATEAPHLSALLVSQPASLRALQESMKKEHYEVLEYLVLEHAVILWHISADAVHVRNVFLPRTLVMEKVKMLNAGLLDRSKPFDTPAAQDLYRFLIQPAKIWIKSERLVVIPHEDLHYLPFQALQNPDDGRYVGEQYALSVAPSATVLLGLKAGAPTTGASLLAVADPDLDAGQDEAQAVAKLYPQRSKLVIDPLARETDVKRWVGDAEVVHLSVHGKFNATEPLLSYLKLARSDSDDGQLSAAEMFGLPLTRSRLVVLSACETGKAQATHASELLGMQRALLFAGANSLVLSYWSVDSDATAIYMRAFHQALQSSTPAMAARAALKTVKKQKDYAHPYYWSAFMLVGR